MNNLSDWDINLAEGKWGENLLTDILMDCGDKLEVKTDYQWQRTGNIYVEYECFYVQAGKDKPSGLSVSQAPYYVFVLPWGEKKPIIQIIPTSLLKLIVKARGREAECTYSQNPSKGYLIKLNDIEDFMRGQVS